MANTKITKRTVINGLLDGSISLADKVAIDYLTHELELLDNRKSSDKPNKKQTENEGIKSDIIDGLRVLGKPVTVSELQGVETLSEFSNQKLSSLLRQLVLDGYVAKRVDGKKSVFFLPDPQ